MLFRKAVVAVGLAVALTGVGTGTAIAADNGAGSSSARAAAQVQDEPLLDVQGLCADGSPAGDAEACESETLNNGYLNACVHSEGGLVSDIAGGEGGIAEQAGLNCPQKMPPREDGEDPPGGTDGSPDEEDGPTPMPPPLNRAEPASPAEPISAQPSFTG